MKRVALVTGTSSGFGLLSAMELAKSGFEVYATMRDLSRSGHLEAALAAASVKCHLLQLDIRDESSVTAALDEVEARAGRIDVLVNNAGTMLAGFAEDLSDDQIREQFETNVFGTLRITKKVLPGMRERCWGRIITITSAGGRIAYPMFSAYHASKFALEGFFEALRPEMSPYNVFVSLVEPGLFRTSMTKRQALPTEATNSPHGVASKRLHRGFRLGVALASLSDPERVSRKVARVAKSRRPGLRHPVGIDARLVRVAAQLNPWGWDRWLQYLSSP